MSSTYLSKLPVVTASIVRYGRSFIVRHYDLPTLFASKLAAILQRTPKGFTVGKPEERIDFKGRDLYDLDWYMQRGILPNEAMLHLNGIDMSIGEVFDSISVFLATRDTRQGLKKDLTHLLRSQGEVESFAETFKERFGRLKEERYTSKKITSLDAIFLQKDIFPLGKYLIDFQYSYEGGVRLVHFLFHIVEDFMVFRAGDIKIDADQELLKKIHYLSQITSEEEKKMLRQYLTLFNEKIVDYLKRHKNEVYLSEWRSKFIMMGNENFNPEKEIVFMRGRDLLGKAVTLELLQIDRIFS